MEYNKSVRDSNTNGRMTFKQNDSEGLLSGGLDGKLIRWSITNGILEQRSTVNVSRKVNCLQVKPTANELIAFVGGPSEDPKLPNCVSLVRFAAE
jgi:hypothetical protein